jgi:hypothetical protein
MGKFLYAIYALVVVSVMSGFSYSPSSSLSSPTNANSYYHGSSSSGGGSSGSGGGGHK